MDQPLVSVICLCYNHAPFVVEALESVFHQTYLNLQIIIVDDASTDNSVAVIERMLGTQSSPNLQFLSLPQNIGNCKAFNQGLQHATGAYVVDFATDDVMLPTRIEQQVKLFLQLDNSYGVVFTDAFYIDPQSQVFRQHYAYLFSKKLLTHVPQGDVYRDVLSTYFVSSPSMLVRKNVLDELGGYDETLAYEDFDFWVRSARRYKYAFINEALTKVRRKHQSLSSGWYVPGDPQLHSTYLVCRKAQKLNRDEGDNEALLKRVRYELRQSVFSQNYEEAERFYLLLKELATPRGTDLILGRLIQWKPPLARLRQLYHHLRY
ncbi:glycosyltransferase family 2 protein [Chryseolinea lacunae]|uniref:Glycosyltransferase n=1 Tax=Chryseolinea lacunae TaxID=2801331 RepID=A0ABS1KLH4_9BACT|nr:glycosyltransferase [Chryseolinea lacunae]MBL0740310.1 glycosyltransferase [Chryseolinea lacunae]